MITWVLMVLVHVGPMGEGNSNSLFSVPGFSSEAECQGAGKKAEKLVTGTVKSLAFVCFEQSKPDSKAPTCGQIISVPTAVNFKK